MAPGLPLLILPVAVAAAILVFVGGRGVSVLNKQSVAWGITALMIVAAIGIGFAKAPGFNGPIPDVPQSAPPTAGSRTCLRNDAGVLSNRTVQELEQRNLRLNERYGVAIGVVTCNYGRDDLYNYALKQAEEMNLGGYDFIVVLDIRGDNYWLVQGAELVDDFTDEDCEYYAWAYMEQAFAGGDYDSAVLKLTEMLEAWYGTYFG